MSAGALRLLGLFQRFWRKYGPRGCYAKAAWFAKELRSHVKSISRWSRELQERGYLQKQRLGRGRPCLYIQADKPPFLQQHVTSDGYLRNPVSITELKTENKTMLALPVPPEPKPRWSNTEREAVCQSIAQFRYSSGEKVKPEAFLGRLEKIASFYGANGHRAAAEFDHVYERVKASPSTAPERANWFMAVLDARLKRKISKPAERESRPIARSGERRANVSERYLAELKAAQERVNLEETRAMKMEPDEKTKIWMAQEVAAFQAKLEKQQAIKDAEAKQMRQWGWTDEQIAAHQKELDEFLEFQAKGGTMAEFLQLPGHGAAGAQAQSSVAERTTDPEKRELYDTGALVGELAGVKSLEYRPAPATMEEIYQALNKRAS